MKALVIRDPDLHAYLLGPEIRETVSWIGRQLAGEADSAWRLNCFTLLRHLGEGDLNSPSADKDIENIFKVCPPNLAERLLEAMGIYRAIGRACLPPLLPLAQRLLQAELHLYTSLKSGKPYRDHLVHQTRVAAMAHLLMGTRLSEALEGFPQALTWGEIRRTWSHTLEFHLIHAYALDRGFDCPDPRMADEWTDVVLAAALLAGLVHDIGYVHKSLGEVAEAVAACFPDLTFPLQVRLPDELDRLPMAALYRNMVPSTGQGQRHAGLGDYLSRSYRDLHSLAGAVWLAGLDARLTELLHKSRQPDRTPTGDGSRSGWFEITAQLAAMMALAHDLALSDPARKARLGLGQKDNKKDALNFQDFPLCTLFALADVVQEFGRPVRLVNKQGIQFVAPLAGLRLEAVKPGERTRKQGRGLDQERITDLETAAALWDLPAFFPSREECLYISYCSRDGHEALLRKEDLRKRLNSDWDETRVAHGQPSWLEQAGLSPHIRLDGDPAALEKIKTRYKALSGILEKKNLPSIDQSMIERLIRLLACLLNPGDLGRRQRATIDDWVKDLLDEPVSEYLPAIAPLADAADPEAGLLPEAAKTLVRRKIPV